MIKFSKTFLNKLTELVLTSSVVDFKTQKPQPALKQTTTQLFRGSSLIDAGDILYFSYKDKERLFFVVTARGGGGTYNTPQNNKVISGYLINDVSVEVIITVLGGLYKNAQRFGFPVRSLFSYKTTKGISRIFRPSNFRTFMTTKIDGLINQLDIKVNTEIKTQED